MIYGAIGSGEHTCSMPADNIYLWVCGKCDRIPDPAHMQRCMNLIQWLKETPKGYPILEWGVYTGTSGMLLSIFGDGDPYKGIDWFLGLAPTEEDGEIPDMNFTLLGEQIRQVRERLPGVVKAAAINAASVIENAASIVQGGSYRFVHIDVDTYYPTKTALFRSWDLLVPGGKMVCDDYSWQGAKKACHEFQDAHPDNIGQIYGTQIVWTKC